MNTENRKSRLDRLEDANAADLADLLTREPIIDAFRTTERKGK